MEIDNSPVRAEDVPQVIVISVDWEVVDQDHAAGVGFVAGVLLSNVVLHERGRRRAWHIGRNNALRTGVGILSQSSFGEVAELKSERAMATHILPLLVFRTFYFRER